MKQTINRKGCKVKYPALQKIHSENDTIVDSSGRPISRVLDYWKWAHSNLLDNAERGVFAEYLIASAIGKNNNSRLNWEKYDLISEEGITIEVKTSAYIQTWGPDRLSSICFGIAKSKGYDSETNIYEVEEKKTSTSLCFLYSQ